MGVRKSVVKFKTILRGAADYINNILNEVAKAARDISKPAEHPCKQGNDNRTTKHTTYTKENTSAKVHPVDFSS